MGGFFGPFWIGLAAFVILAVAVLLRDMHRDRKANAELLDLEARYANGEIDHDTYLRSREKLWG